VTQDGGEGGSRGIDRLVSVVARLRSEGGCPWDREQTIRSLKPYLIEEAYELIDAIDSDDVDRHADELGDVLLQVMLQSRIREEEGHFTFDDVAGRLAEKLVRRHPHVFGDAVANDAGEVLRHWEAIKAEEKDGGRSVVEGVPRHLPALHKAQRVQARVARVGFDWERAADVLDKVEEEIGEVRQSLRSGESGATREEIGDLLFALVNLCRFLSINAEEALQESVEKFKRRFQEVERRVREQGRSVSGCSLDELEAHWQAAKEREKGRG